MKISIDKFNKRVLGLYRPLSLLTFEVDLPDTVNPIKNVVGEVNGESLVTLSDNPEYFTLDELLEIKSNHYLNVTNKDFIILEDFIDDSGIDLAFSEHRANTGVKFIQILPYGKLKLNPIPLECPSTHFILANLVQDDLLITLNGELVVDGEVIFSEEQTDLDIIVENTTDSSKLLDSLILTY